LLVEIDVLIGRHRRAALFAQRVRGGEQVQGGAWQNFDPQSGQWWYVVDYEGQRGYADARFLDASGRIET